MDLGSLRIPSNTNITESVWERDILKGLDGAAPQDGTSRPPLQSSPPIPDPPGSSPRRTFKVVSGTAEGIPDEMERRKRS